MQLEKWEETSIAMAQENDILKLRMFRLLEEIQVKNRPAHSNTIREALLDCGLTEQEIVQFINGNLRLGD